MHLHDNFACSRTDRLHYNIIEPESVSKTEQISKDPFVRSTTSFAQNLLFQSEKYTKG